MSDSRIEGYARGLFEIARAEGTIDEVEDELFRFARSYESSEELRNAPVEPLLPIEKKLIGWSLGIGVALLIVLVLFTRGAAGVF